MEILKNLTPQQRFAVEKTDGPILILAGSGTGKTKVVICKILYLIKNKKVKPSNILCLTFANKLAEEIKEEVINECNIPPDNDIWISTFYSACARILRSAGEKIGLPPNFVIFDEDDQIALVRDCLQELNLAGRDTSSSSILSSIQRAKDNFIYPDDYEKDVTCSFKKIVARVYRLYQEKLAHNRALDFGDIILQTITLFKKDPKTLSYYQDKFKYVLVDEHQDTNLSQAEFLRMITKKHKNLCVVGDEDQGIYGWKGATIQNILNFEKEYTNCTKIFLEENYRTTPNILEVANRVLKFNTLRLGKNVFSKRASSQEPIFYRASNEYEEAWFVAREILERKKQEKKRYSDFAVLYRTPSQSRIFEEAFAQSNIPYKIIGGEKFFQRKEIKDIISYLRVLSNPYDNLSFKRIINAPLRGIGSVTLSKMEQMAVKNKMSLSEIIKDKKYLGLLRPSIVDTLTEFNAFLDELNRIKNKKSYSEICKIILKKTGYLEEIEKEETQESKEKIRAINNFINVIRSKEKEVNSLTELLERISLHNEIDDYDKKEDSVSLITLHNAKGLEFPVVFLVGLEEGIFPHWVALKDNVDLEEERRLCYVGITRCRDILYITCAHSRNSYGGVKYNKISRFIEELGLLDKNIGYKEPKGKEQKEELKKSRDTFKVGDKVYHDRWGEGEVLEVEGTKEDKIVKVKFLSVGLKNLILKYAPLRKI